MATKTFLKTTLKISLFLVVLTFNSTSHAKTIYVDDDGPADFNNIQAAIDDSNDGDILSVADGTYTGKGNRNIDFLGKAISVRSENGPQNCIIDCREQGRAFHFQSGEDENSIVQGFTITNGIAPEGGAIYCSQSSPTLMNCVFRGNKGTNDDSGGGAIYNHYCSPTVINCTFIENEAYPSAAFGGAIHNDASSPTLTNCTFINNDTWSGGAIYNSNNSNPILTNCTFTTNTASRGGAVSSVNSSPTLVDCIFTGNSAFYGGGISNRAGNQKLVNCSFIGNVASVGGGAVWNSGAVDVVFLNCMFSGNAADGDTGGAIESNTAFQTLFNCTFSENTGAIEIYDYSVLKMQNCIVADDKGRLYFESGNVVEIDYCCIQDWVIQQYGGTGNFDADPCFVDPDGDDNIFGTEDDNLRLLPGSPCIDAGDPNYIPEPNETDLDGSPRIIAGRIDMGAFEYQPRIIYVDGDATGANDGSSWTDAYNYLQDALAVAYSGDEIHVAQGIYKPDQGDGMTPGDKTATFQLKNGVALAGGYAGAGASVPNERDVQSYETVLNGQGFIDHVVTGSGTDASAILDGVTVKGGQADGSYPEGQGAGMLNMSGSPTVIKCTFKENWANRLGGAMYNRQGSNPTVIDCRFEDNTAYEFSGGAIHSSSASSPVIRNCKFINNRCGLKSENYTSQGGAICNKDGDVIILNCEFVGNQTGREGAAIYVDGGQPVVSHCKFYANSCTQDGGAIYIYGSGTVLNVSHCVFTNNTARYGGALAIRYAVSVDLTNCSFYRNEAYFYGGAVWISEFGGPASRISNCIFWQNQDVTGMTESAQVNSGVSLPVENSVLQGLQEYKGAGNIDLDPRFMDADGVDNQLGTADDNLRLLPDSPCVNAGSNAAVPPDVLDLDNDGDLTEPIPIDLDGDPRFVDSADPPISELPTVDMGPYENPKQGFVLLPDRIEVPEGGTAVFSVALSCDPASGVQVHIEVESGDENITIQEGQTLHFTSDDYWIPKHVTVAAEEDSDRFTGKADILISAEGIRPSGVLALEAENEPYADVILVDDDATGLADGSSWDDAFTSLQDALDEVYGTVSDDDAAAADQAESTIKQIWVAQGVYRPTEDSNRRISFILGNGLVIKGGYAGCMGPNPDERDIRKYETILSGDLMGNDTPSLSPENLLTDSSRTDNTLTVVWADGVNRSAILDGCTIYGGQADGAAYSPFGDGGGIYMVWANPMLKNCTFRENAAKIGAGFFNEFGLPLLLNCSFERNNAESGAGLYNHTGGPTLRRCRFEDNYAYRGAGLYSIAHTVLTLDSCIFNSNTATYEAGAIDLYEWGGRTTLTNCLLTKNRAPNSAAIDCDAEVSGALILNNCTITENEAEDIGGGIFSRYGGLEVSNCIFWANADSTGYTETAQIHVPYPAPSYTCVQGWTGQWPGVGNIGSDPYFAAPPNGGYHLLPDSPCIDAGDPNYIPEPNDTDLDGSPRIINGRIDMGAYEYDSTMILALVDIDPGTLNVQSKGKWITAFIQLPEEYNVTNIEPDSVLLASEIKPEKFWLNEDNQIAIAKFDREQVQIILDVGDINLTITGRLNDGTLFEATDTIKVIDKGGRKSSK